MKHLRLLSAFLAFLFIYSSHVLAQQGLREVSGFAGVSPLPREMKQGNVAFSTPMPKHVKIRKGVVGKRAVSKYADKVPQQKEGYYLRISKYEIVMVGRDAEGLYYAEQTLNQLLERGGSVLETEIRDWPSVECRGAIEGFYGNPWSHQDRLRQFQFYGRNKMNMYVYGPKDDPYHRRHWREPYPAKEAKQLGELVKEAKRNHVQFVWAVHPGLDIKWNRQDSLAIVKKLESVYSLGVRTFAVFFDDISGEGTQADKQAGLMNYITMKFVWKHKDVKPLIICPTQYNKGWSHGDYLNTLGFLMYPEIRIMWTGNSVVDMIEKNDMEWINGQINRKAFIWLNYPVNDYCQSRILMGKTYGNGKDIADMQDIAVEAIPVDIVEIKLRVCAEVGKECALLGFEIAHHQRERGDALADHVRRINIFMLAELFHHEIAFGILAVSAEGIELHFGIELRKINDDVAERAAGGTCNAVLNPNQFALLRPTHCGIENIYDHVARDTNTLLHLLTSKVIVNL